MQSSVSLEGKLLNLLGLSLSTYKMGIVTLTSLDCCKDVIRVTPIMPDTQLACNKRKPHPLRCCDTIIILVVINVTTDAI